MFGPYYKRAFITYIIINLIEFTDRPDDFYFVYNLNLNLKYDFSPNVIT